MKAIIKRHLSLSVHYTVTDKKYIPLTEGCGCTCDNCGKLIANIATVKSSEGVFNIGFDCMETLLINNSLLSATDIQDYERIKKMIPKVIRFAKELKEILDLNKGRLDGFMFERPNKYETNYITFYLMQNGCKPYNTNRKCKDVDFDFLITTLKAILPRIDISIKA